MVLLWLWSYSTLVHAATLGPFSADVQGFDFESLLYAAAMGLLGGAGRTIFSLASDNVLVGSLWREGTKDAVIAIFSGVLAWGAVTYLANFWPNIFTSEARMILIVWAGATRGKAIDMMGKAIDGALGNLRKRIAGQAPSVDAPSSAAMPLEDPPK